MVTTLFLRGDNDSSQDLGCLVGFTVLYGDLPLADLA
jgi:hypothetical protein